LERVIDHYSVKLNDVAERSPYIAKNIIESISTVISASISLIYQSSITKNYGCEQIAFLLIKIYEKMRKLLDFNDKKLGKGNILEQLIL